MFSTAIFTRIEKYPWQNIFENARLELLPRSGVSLTRDWRLLKSLEYHGTMVLRGLRGVPQMRPHYA